MAVGDAADSFTVTDAHADADANAPATPDPLSAGRHAATYELEFYECIRLRQKIDAQRNTINNLEAEIVNLGRRPSARYESEI
eukprot:2730376-Pleurochrysis_carterae.AAC.1